MSEELEQKQELLSKKMFESEDYKRRTVLKLDVVERKQVQGKIESFKKTSKSLLEPQVYVRMLELFNAKKMVEDLDLTVREIGVSAKELEENGVEIESMLNKLHINLTDLLTKMSLEVETQNAHRDRERETMDKIDSYIDQYG